MRRTLSPTRPMDQVRLAPDEPHEDEFALLRLIDHSPLERLIFPRSARYFLLDEEPRFVRESEIAGVGRRALGLREEGRVRGRQARRPEEPVPLGADFAARGALSGGPLHPHPARPARRDPVDAADVGAPRQKPDARVLVGPAAHGGDRRRLPQDAGAARAGARGAPRRAARGGAASRIWRRTRCGTLRALYASLDVAFDPEHEVRVPGVPRRLRGYRKNRYSLDPEVASLIRERLGGAA